ncbi:MFS transporter [Lactococcus hircilactis]|uniref:MFS transporter n=1 Tax=Lactococcus hircilactis TaxID=1494462 RepID=A0A7X2D1V3_9LACT|nr:MFS transporter [Lactococcus hircilactis]MQW39817.1 MFS transporter [Lactococcus hircilactis]
MPKRLKFLFSSRMFSEFPATMFPIVLPLYILHLRGSLAISGVFFTLTMLPTLCLTPLIGVWVEQRSKRKVILAVLLSLAVIDLLLSGFILSFDPLSLLTIGIFAALISIAIKISEISSKVLFTELVNKIELQKYNGIQSVLDNVATFSAPIIGTVIYGFFGFQTVLIIGACCYLVAFFLMRQLKMSATPRLEAEVISVSTDRNNLSSDKDAVSSDKVRGSTTFIQQMKEGLIPIRENPQLLKLIIMSASLNFFVANCGEIINPGILIQKYHLSSSLFGFVEVAFMLGVIFSGLWISRKKGLDLMRHLARSLQMTTFLSIFIGIFSLVFEGKNQFIFLGIFLILQLLLGFSMILVNVPIMSYYQSQVPHDVQSRFFSLSSFLGSIAISLGVTVAGILAEHFGADVTLIFNNLCVLIIVIFVFRKGPIVEVKK